MEKTVHEDIDVRFNSIWDVSTWGILLLTAVFCGLPFFFDDDGWLPLIVTAVVLLFVVVTLKSTYYRIQGDRLLVYTFFVPSSYPISKISGISPSKSWLSAPATSLTQRIAIRFTDRSVLKSSFPLVISPVRRDEFIALLRSINPGIKVDG